MILQQLYRPLSLKEMKEKRGIKEFIITIDTRKEDSASNTFGLVIEEKTADDVVIEWGDGTNESFSTVGLKTHEYTTPGIYQIKVSPSMTGFYYNGLKLLSIDNWGYAEWTSFYRTFSGCENMVGNYSDFPNTSNVTNMESMFHGCSNFNQPVNFDTSNVTNMESMFNGCSNFKQSLAQFNIEKVTDFLYFAAETNINEIGTTTNYDETLVSWGNQEVHSEIYIFFGDAKHSAVGKVGKDKLLNKGWHIDDGGDVDKNNSNSLLK